MKKQLEMEVIFEFTSFQQWVNSASKWFKPYRFEPTICLDKDGHVLHIGEDFMLADAHNLFPVTVYKLRRLKECIEKPTL